MGERVVLMLRTSWIQTFGFLRTWLLRKIRNTSGRFCTVCLPNSEVTPTICCFSLKNLQFSPAWIHVAPFRQAFLIVSSIFFPCYSSFPIDYGLDGPENESRWAEIFRSSRPILGPTQPPIQWVPGLSRGNVRPGRAADHLPPSSAAVMEE